MVPPRRCAGACKRHRSISATRKIGRLVTHSKRPALIHRHPFPIMQRTPCRCYIAAAVVLGRHAQRDARTSARPVSYLHEALHILKDIPVSKLPECVDHSRSLVGGAAPSSVNCRLKKEGGESSGAHSRSFMFMFGGEGNSNRGKNARYRIHCHRTGDYLHARPSCC
jgi:hypothetical protein